METNIIRALIKERETIGYTLLALATTIILVNIAALAHIHYWTTIGRVTYKKTVTPLTGNTTQDLLITATLLTITTVLTVGTKKKRALTPPLTLTALSILTTLLNNPQATLILQTTAIASIIYHAAKTNRLTQLKQGILYTIAGVEVPVILFYTYKVITGQNLTQLIQAVQLEATIWGLLWWTCPTVLFLAPILKLLQMPRLRNMKQNKQSQSGNLNDRGEGLQETSKKRDTAIYLTLGATLSLLIPLIPYLPHLNPKQHPVNVDWIYYYNWLKIMIKEGPQTVLTIAYGSRPIHLLLLYALWFLTRLDPKTIAVHHNLLLFPLYTLSMYYMTREYYGREVAKYALLITPLTPIFISFLYGGFQANLLALSLWMLTLGLLAKPTRKRLTAATALSTLTVFIHPWTWTQYIGTLTAIIAANIILSKMGNKRLLRENLTKPILTLILVNIVANMIKEVTLKTLGATEALQRTLIRSLLTQKTILKDPIGTLNFIFNIYTWGSLNYPLYYISYTQGYLQTPLTLISWLTIIPLTLTPLTNVVLFYRILLNIPLTIFMLVSMKNSNPTSKLVLTLHLTALTLRNLVNSIPGQTIYSQYLLKP